MVASSSRLLDWLGTDTNRALRLEFDVEETSIANFISLSGTFDEYLARFDSKQRYNLRSRAKKLYEQHGVRYTACGGDEEAGLRRVFTLHRQRATRKGIASSFEDPRVHAFHEALAARIRDQAWLSLRFLTQDEKVIAASYNFEFAGRVFSYQKGFDPEWERYGPGSVLMYELIREAFANQRLEYNFLQGNESYKSVWARDYRTLSSVNIYNNSLLGRVAREGYRLKRTVKRGLGRQRAPVTSPGRARADAGAVVGTPAPDHHRRATHTVESAGIEAMHWIKGEWNALAASMRYPTVFCMWEWIFTWWEHFGAGRDLRLLLVRRNGQLKGILPLFSERRFFGSDGRIGRVLGYCSASELFPDPLDIVSAPADARKCAEAALGYLKTTSKDWDVLHLRFLTEDSDLLRCVADAGHGDSRTEQISGAPHIPIAGTYDGYLQSLSGNERSKIGRCRRKLMGRQGVEYVDLGSENMPQVLQALLELHEKRAAEKKIHSSFARADVIAFHRDLLNRIDRSHVWLRGLRYRGALIAVFYGYALGGRISYYQLGHDPAWGTFSPGVVLLQETIREAFERGFTEYNFLQGEEEFKYRWTSQIRRLHAIDVFNRSPLGWLSHWAIRARLQLKSGASVLLER
jgi:CelD/BcsL family acetyltransferase involved in cellulose biosynthesis